MNSGLNQITFGSSVDDSMSSELIADKDEDEEDIDAFNDETFGNAVDGDDWEEEHEKFSSTLAARKGNLSQSSDSEHRDNRGLNSFDGDASSNAQLDALFDTSLLNKRFSNLNVNSNKSDQIADKDNRESLLFNSPLFSFSKNESEMETANAQSMLSKNLSLWNTSNLTPKTQVTVEQPSVCELLSSNSKMKTLEEVEHDLFSNNVIKRPIRLEELEASLLANDSSSIKSKTIKDLNPSFSEVADIKESAGGWNPFAANIGANISEIIPNGTLLNSRFSNESISSDLNKQSPKINTDLRVSKDDSERKAINWKQRPPPGASPNWSQDHHLPHQQMFSRPPLGSPIPIGNPMNPLIPHHISKNMMLMPTTPFPNSPFPGRQIIMKPTFPFPYNNQIRNMNPFSLQRLPLRNMCLVPLNRFPPHPLLQQQQQQQHRNFYQKQQHPSASTNNQQSSNRNRHSIDDEYAGLMTQREKDWLIKIQLMQLEPIDPYVDDYYNVELQSRKIVARNKLNTKDGKANLTTALVLPERPKAVNESSNSYVPRQFEGSLGKISVCNVNCPRKLLDFNKKELTQDSERPSTPSVRYELKKLRALLSEIEHLYVVLLNIDDEDKRLNALPEEAKKLRLEKRKELCEKLFNGITDSTHEHINFKIAGIRKGCSLIFRSLLMFDEPKHKAIIAGELLDINNFSFVVTQKDQTIYGLDYGQILIDCIKTLQDCDFEYILHIANSLNDVATVAKYQCGEEIIQTIITQSLCFGNKTNEQKSKWRAFVDHVLEEVEDIPRLRKFCVQHLESLD